MSPMKENFNELLVAIEQECEEIEAGEVTGLALEQRYTTTLVTIFQAWKRGV